MARSVGESQLQRIIRDLHDSVMELCTEHRENGEPVTDDSTSLHKFCYKLEYLLQFDQKEKTTLLGFRKDYWEYFCDCLARTKGANDGIRFVKSIPELKTSLGKGRAFVRYSLVHQRLADTLQQCLMNQKLTSDWYYMRSPFLQPQQISDVVAQLYELNQVQFDLGSRGLDLDSAWPTFARRSLGLGSSPASPWKPPSRCSSIGSLAGPSSPAMESFSSPDVDSSLPGHLNETTRCNMADDLRLELDQSELRQQALCKELSQSEQKQRELRSELDQSEKKRQDLHAELSQSQKTQQELRVELNQLEQKQRDLLEDADSEVQQRSACGATQGEEEATELQEALRQREQEATELQEALTQREQEATELQEALTQREKEATELQEALTQREQEATELQEALTQREQEATELQEALTQREKEATELQEVLTQREQEATELQEALTQREKEATELQEALTQREQEATELQEALTQREQEATELQEALTQRELQKEAQTEGSEAGLQREAGPQENGAESRLECAEQEVSRLREEVQEMRGRLQEGSESEGRAGARLGEAEAEREALREQLREVSRAQREQEEHREQEAREQEAREEEHREVRAAQELAALQEQLAEAQEGLELANAATAELGVATCALTAEREEAARKWAELEAENSGLKAELEANAGLKAELEAENSRLKAELQAQGEELQQAQEKLPEAERDLQARLGGAELRAREEADALRFQLSSETMSHQNQLQALSGELSAVRAELERMSLLKATQSETQAADSRHSQLLGENNNRVAQCEKELQILRDNLTRSEQELGECRSVCEGLRESLRRAREESQSSDLKMSTEIDDLNRTKRNLEERLIQLIKEKDALWQKSDALEFEQKRRDEQVSEREAVFCSSCHGQFSWFNRRHPCGLCGRAFCSSCCNSTVTQPGGRQERCCRDCHTQRRSGVERPLLPQTPHTPAGDDDVVFDIITEDEVNKVNDSDLPGPERREGPQGALQRSNSSSTIDTTPEDPEERVPDIHDVEIYLLKSGELTLSVPLSLAEVAESGDGSPSRELFIKSSGYSLVCVEVGEAGTTLRWAFSSEPKSISFGLVYREGPHCPLQEAKVLLPLTRCNSHKEEVHGQLLLKNPGTYLLIFDNSFSRFVSKNVLYRLAVDKALVHDGRDSS
ncbi:FYVE and coiled-coil domain-containing protein 1-like isoform X2 [Conger conger]|uniref:FYVE and coiled-coil domain-containing protein 1-like isoform X2 n=1 Tax=Conger conger TaxID=82655 RepID=UPI002A599A92|nr:FYVE and coiled-coil domain-containing protein 1-like isoform X2 [Conger conger]